VLNVGIAAEPRLCTPTCTTRTLRRSASNSTPRRHRLWPVFSSSTWVPASSASRVRAITLPLLPPLRPHLRSNTPQGTNAGQAFRLCSVSAALPSSQFTAHPQHADHGQREDDHGPQHLDHLRPSAIAADLHQRHGLERQQHGEHHGECPRTRPSIRAVLSAATVVARMMTAGPGRTRPRHPSDRPSVRVKRWCGRGRVKRSRPHPRGGVPRDRLGPGWDTPAVVQPGEPLVRSFRATITDGGTLAG